MYKNQLFLSLVLTLALLAPAAIADNQGRGWTLRFGGVWVNPDVDFSDIDSDGGRVDAGSDSAFGVNVGIERRFNPRFGIEVGALTTQPDLDLDAVLAEGIRFSVSDGVRLTAITAGLNFHLTPNKSWDLYFGPSLVYSSYGDLGFNIQVAGQSISQSFSSSDDFGLGAQLGADIPFGDSSWSLNLTARYFDTVLEVTDDEGEVTDLDFDPVILGVGVGYRF